MLHAFLLLSRQFLLVISNYSSISDVYAQSMQYDRHFFNQMQILNKALKDELHVQEEGMKLLGALEQIFTILTPPPKEALENQVPPPVQNEKGMTELEQRSATEINDAEMENNSSVDIDFYIDAHNKSKIVID